MGSLLVMCEGVRGEVSDEGRGWGWGYDCSSSSQDTLLAIPSQRTNTSTNQESFVCMLL